MLKFLKKKDTMLIEEDLFPPVATINTINANIRAVLDVKKKPKEREES